MERAREKLTGVISWVAAGLGAKGPSWGVLVSAPVLVLTGNLGSPPGGAVSAEGSMGGS